MPQAPARAIESPQGPACPTGLCATTAWLAAVLLLGCGASQPSGAHPAAPVSFGPTESSTEAAGDIPGEAPSPEDDVPPIDFPSCEQARDGNVESVDLASRGNMPPDIPLSEYSAVLGRGTYLVPCGVPSTAAVTVCAAVVQGKAVGITVTLSPHNQRIINCVIEGIQGLSFPSHPRMDIATTRFEPGP